MKALIVNIVCCFLCSSSFLFAQLSGTYTVGSTEADFDDLLEVSQTLGDVGFGGDCIFQLFDGVYEDNVYFPSGNYASMVTVESFSGNPENVILYPYDFYEHHNLVVRNLTLIPRQINDFAIIHKGCRNVTIEQCIVMDGDDEFNTSGLKVYKATDCTFKDITFRNLEVGIVYSNVTHNGSRHHVGRNEISDCNFEFVHYPIEVSGIIDDDPETDSLYIARNTLIDPIVGIYVWGDGVDRAIIHGNRVINASEYGILLEDLESEKISVFNNFIISGPYVGNIQGTYEGETYTSGYLRSIRLNNCPQTRVVHNSIFGSIESSNNNNVYLKNNLFYSDTTVLTIRNEESALVANNNCYYRTDGLWIMRHSGEFLKDIIPNHVAFLERDFLSVSTDPMITSDTDLHATSPYIQFAGASLDSLLAYPEIELLWDIDGELRNFDHPDIGADEFNSSSLPPVAEFSWMCTQGTEREFQNISVRDSSVLWIFPNDSLVIGNNHVYDFSEAGNYEVLLIVENPWGIDSVIHVIAIEEQEVVIGFTGELLYVDGEYEEYEWYLNGGPIPDNSSSIFNPVFSGEYSCGVLTSSGCWIVSQPIFFDDILSINKSEISIYPNPIEPGSNLYVTGTIGNARCTLLDIYGRELAYLKLNESSLLIPSDLPCGIYFIETSDSKNGVIHMPLVIE